MRMTPPRFYWECRGQKLAYDPAKTYLVYFGGCFSPAHRGHFNQIQDALQYPNVHVMVHQIGDVRRHGVPYGLSSLVMKTYARELLGNARARLTIKRRRSLAQVLEQVQKLKPDVLVVIRGAEKEKLNIAGAESTVLRRMRPLLTSLPRENCDCAFVYSERPLVETLSATRFTEALQKTWHKDWASRYARLQPFFPVGLHPRVAKRLVQRLDRCKLVVQNAH